MRDCEHFKRCRRWVPDYYGESEHGGEWQDDWVSSCVDIDLHRYKCTQCGEIGYYSGRAKAYFENNGKNPDKVY